MWRQLTSRIVGDNLYPARNRRMGMDSPRTGAPSIISYFAIVSFSVYVLGPVPATWSKAIGLHPIFLNEAEVSRQKGGYDKMDITRILSVWFPRVNVHVLFEFP